MTGRRGALHLITALFVCVASSVGCETPSPTKQSQEAQPRSEAQSPGEGSASLGDGADAAEPDDPPAHATWTLSELALAYCPYTQGPVPHWILAERFASLLLPSERSFALAIRDETKAVLNEVEHPRQVAASRWIAEHTHCVVEGEVVKEDVAAIALRQTVPNIVEPRRRIVEPADADFEALEEAWFQAFEREWDGANHEDSFGLRLKQVDGSWYVDAQLESRFKRPREEARAQDASEEAMERRDWAKARELYLAGCSEASQSKRCRALAWRLERGEEQHRVTTPFRALVLLEGARVSGRVASPKKVVPVLRVEVANNSPYRVDGVWVEAVGEAGATEVCRLLEEGRSNSLALDAGARGAGRCDFRGAPLEPVQLQLRDLSSAAALAAHQEKDLAATPEDAGPP